MFNTAMSKCPTQQPSLLNIAETSVIPMVSKIVLFHVSATLFPFITCIRYQKNKSNIVLVYLYCTANAMIAGKSLHTLTCFLLCPRISNKIYFIIHKYISRNPKFRHIKTRDKRSNLSLKRDFRQIST